VTDRGRRVKRLAGPALASEAEIRPCVLNKL
jgi:hypothetical protein